MHRGRRDPATGLLPTSCYTGPGRVVLWDRTDHADVQLARALFLSTRGIVVVATGGPLSCTGPAAPVDARLVLLHRPDRANTDQPDEVDMVGVDQVDKVGEE